MWFTIALNFLKSKTGMITIAVVVVLALFAGYRVQIASLHSKIDRITIERDTAEFRNTMCQTDIKTLQTSVDNQNLKIEELERAGVEMSRKAEESARKVIRDHEAVDAMVSAGNGPDALNEFMNELFNGE